MNAVDESAAVFSLGISAFRGHWRRRSLHVGQPEFKAVIPKMTVEMIVQLPFAKAYRKLAPNPDGLPEPARMLIALEQEPMALEKEVTAPQVPERPSFAC